MRKPAMKPNAQQLIGLGMVLLLVHPAFLPGQQIRQASPSPVGPASVTTRVALAAAATPAATPAVALKRPSRPRSRQRSTAKARP